jgi:ribonuclease P protein component
MAGEPMFTFSKEERLCSRSSIERIFAGGSSFFLHPFAVHYQIHTGNPLPQPAQVAFAVSKKRFRKAVDRNLMKRRLREVYRLNKVKFYEQLNASNKQVVFLVSYSAKDLQSVHYLNQKLPAALDRLVQELNALPT